MFVQAAHYYPGRLRPVGLIVLHDMEAPEKATTAESVAAYFARPDSREASAHYCIDSDSVVGCVHEQDTAFGAKGANADGLHLEHAGYARQTLAEWLDPYGRQMLARSAVLTADLCRRYSIPARRLTPEQIRDGQRGICGHGDVTAAYPPGTGHTDPGAGFPWQFYLDLVNAALYPVDPEKDEMTPDDWKRMDDLLDDKIRILERAQTAAGKPTGHANLRSITGKLDAIAVKLGIKL